MKIDSSAFLRLTVAVGTLLFLAGLPAAASAQSGGASVSGNVTDDTGAALPGATITVTNLDNSRSVQCVSSVGGAPPEETVVLATATFAQIADLTDAPVPVQITWATN